MDVAFDLALPSLRLEAGARIGAHVARVWIWGPANDERALAAASPVVRSGAAVRRSAADLAAIARRRGPRLDPNVPTVLLVHALTGEARAGGEGGYWSPLIGPGRALDPREVRIIGINLLGSCYGSSGPADEGFPTREDDDAAAPWLQGKGQFALPPGLPATITTADQARAILSALDALGIDEVTLATGGSLGGMVVLALAALAPERFQRIAPIAACEAASSWIVALNHVGRQAIVSDPGFPANPARGFALARELAMISYRAEAGLDLAQEGRAQHGVATGAWSPHAPYRVQTWLEHHGDKLVRRFDARAYLALLGAMDHHDLARLGGLDRIRASVLAVGIDSDQLYFPRHTSALVRGLTTRGVHAREATLSSPHGHDAFLIEWEPLAVLLRRALALPPPGGS